MQSLPPLSPDDLTVQLHRADGSLIAGLAVAAQNDGGDARVTVDFPAAEELDLAVGSELALRFEGGPLTDRHSTAGRVVFRNSDRIRDRYQFLVPDEAERALAPVVNARGAVRVHLDEDHAVQVVLRVREREEEETKEIEPTIARLVDLSGLGLSVLVDAEAEARFAGCEEIAVALTLPDEGVPMELPGTIRYRQLTAEGIKYGIHFRPSAAAGFSNLRERIYRFVMAEHSREIRRRRAS